MNSPLIENSMANLTQFFEQAMRFALSLDPLTLGLAALGLLLIILVLLINFFQVRRAQPAADAAEAADEAFPQNSAQTTTAAQRERREPLIDAQQPADAVWQSKYEKSKLSNTQAAVPLDVADAASGAGAYAAKPHFTRPIDTVSNLAQRNREAPQRTLLVRDDIASTQAPVAIMAPNQNLQSPELTATSAPNIAVPVSTPVMAAVSEVATAAQELTAPVATLGHAQVSEPENFAQNSVKKEPVHAAALSTEPPIPVDTRVHSIVRLLWAQGISAAKANDIGAHLLTQYPNVMSWAVLDGIGQWFPYPIPTNNYPKNAYVTRMAFSMPLATRSGAVAEKTLRDWVATIETIGREYGGQTMHTPLLDDAKRAVELDQFCSSIDLVAGLTLMRQDHTPFMGTRLRGTLEAEGFKLTQGGYFELRSEESRQVIFQVHNAQGQMMTVESLRQESVRGISLVLDIMRVPSPLPQFDAMRSVAKRLCSRLDAHLVDERGEPMSDNAITFIRSELDMRIKAARSAGIEPGSPLALVLFAD